MPRWVACLPSKVASLVVAYEPIWAIGTGRTATSDDAQQVCATIRGCITEIAGAESAAAVRIQYGGSVKSSNIAELIAQPDIDGALVGGASLDPDEFARICKLGSLGRTSNPPEFSARFFEQSERSRLPVGKQRCYVVGARSDRGGRSESVVDLPDEPSACLVVRPRPTSLRFT